MQADPALRDVIVAVQALASLVLAILVWHHYSKRGRRHLRYWAFGWLSLAIYCGVNTASDWWFVSDSPFAPRWLIWSSIAHAAIYSASVLFMAGGYDLLRPGRLSRPRLYLALSLAWVISSGLVFGSAEATPLVRYLLRSGFSSLTLGLALLLTASFVGRAAAKLRLRTYFLTASSLAYGTLRIVIFVAIALGMFGDTRLLQLSTFFGPIDLLLGFCVGIGMLIWHIEGESQAVIDATNALRESEARLRQSQKMQAVGQLAGGIAHDFNNLLTVIQGYSELLADGVAQGSEVYQAADEIKSATRRASSLTQNLLAFSRQQVLEPQSVELGALVRQVSAVADRTTSERIKLETSVADTPLQVHLDPGQFQQVLLNLIINARDAMPDGGRIDVSASRVGATATEGKEPNWCLVTVSDEGEGMSDETLARIFDPFFSTKKDGTGLGLPTALGIVEQSGGRIDVKSQVGEGSRFSIHLPLAVESQDLGETAARHPSLGPRTVLLVEDDASVRRLVTAMLGKENLEVLPQPSAEAALEALTSGETIDLVLTDVVLPGMSGPDFIRQAQELRPRLPAIMMTGYAAEAASLVQESSCEVVRKPFDKQRILDAVHRALAP